MMMKLPIFSDSGLYMNSIKATQKSSELLAVSQADIALPDVEKTLQPFIKDDVLVSIIKEDFPCTAEQFFTKLLNDDSKFTHQYRAERKDSEIKTVLSVLNYLVHCWQDIFLWPIPSVPF
eukprot:Gb_02861 [translate_table: standard]